VGSFDADQKGRRPPAASLRRLLCKDEARRIVAKITNVCFWHKADIQLSSGNVRFWG